MGRKGTEGRGRRMSGKIEKNLPSRTPSPCPQNLSCLLLCTTCKNLPRSPLAPRASSTLHSLPFGTSHSTFPPNIQNHFLPCNIRNSFPATFRTHSPNIQGPFPLPHPQHSEPPLLPSILLALPKPPPPQVSLTKQRAIKTKTTTDLLDPS